MNRKHAANSELERIAIEATYIPTCFELAHGRTYISIKEIAMFKVAVVAFALAVSGFMLWVGHENSNFAQLPHATFVKRAA